MRTETFKITTKIENILIVDKIDFGLFPIEEKYFTFRIADKGYAKIDTGYITQERTFTLVPIFIFYCLKYYMDFRLPIKITTYNHGDPIYFSLDNEYSRMYTNDGIIPYTKENGILELQSQYNNYPVITGIKFEVIIERPI